MKQIWSQLSELQNTDSTRWIFLSDSPQNVNRSTDERIGNDMAEKVEAQLITGQSLDNLKSLISKNLVVKTYHGSNLRLRNSDGKIIGRLKNGESVTFLDETKITTDSNGQSRDTDGDGSLDNRHLWFKIKSNQGKTGWISAEYLQGNLEQPTQPPSEYLESNPANPQEEPQPSTLINPDPDIPADPESKPEPEPTPEAKAEPDTVDFSSLPGAASRNLNVQIKKRRIVAQDFVDTNHPVQRGTTSLEARAISQPENLNLSQQKKAISDLVDNTGLKPSIVTQILSDLGLNSGATHEEVLDKLGKIEDGGKLSTETKSVLSAMQRIPEAGQLLAPFRHPSVIRFLRGSAVFGGVMIHKSLWQNATNLEFSGFDENGFMPRSGNSVVDTAAYFVPFAGNLYDYDEGIENLKKGEIGWAAFNFATGTAGMVLDVFSVVTAPTGVGPVAGQSARVGLKAAVKSIKLSIKSGAVTKAAKKVLDGASAYTPNIIKDGAKSVANAGRHITNAAGWARGKVLTYPDKWVRSLEESATTSLANAKNADTGFLSKVGSSIAYGAKETVSGFYNITTLKFIATPSNINAAFDAARASQYKDENPKASEIDGVNFKKNQILRVDQDGAKGVDIKVEKIQVNEDGKVTVTGKDIENGKTVTFDSETPGLKITPKSKEKKLEQLGELAKPVDKKIGESYKRRFGSDHEKHIFRLKDIRTARDKDIKELETQKSKFESELKEIKDLPTKTRDQRDKIKSLEKEIPNIDRKINEVRADYKTKVENLRAERAKSKQEKKIENLNKKINKLENKAILPRWRRPFTSKKSLEKKIADLENEKKNLINSDPNTTAKSPKVTKKTKPRQKKPIPDKLETTLPRGLFLKEGKIHRLQTGRIGVGETKEVEKALGQEFQIGNSDPKKAKSEGINIKITQTGATVKTRNKKGINTLHTGRSYPFKLSDGSSLKIELMSTTDGISVKFTRLT